jgi:hypothetical protein
MENIRIKVEAIQSDTSKLWVKQEINSFGRFGKEIKISPKSNCTVNDAGFRLGYHTESVSLQVSIGNIESAILTMTKEAWELLQLLDTKDIEIETTEQFKKKIYTK